MDFTGTHLLIDLFDCRALDDCAAVERTLRDAVAAAGATLLDLHVHGFGEGQGVTGIALLAESHISIHTWPERDYAAADIFLCGRNHDLPSAMRALEVGLHAGRCEVRAFDRGFGMAPAAA